MNIPLIVVRSPVKSCVEVPQQAPDASPVKTTRAKPRGKQKKVEEENNIEREPNKEEQNDVENFQNTNDETETKVVGKIQRKGAKKPAATRKPRKTATRNKKVEEELNEENEIQKDDQIIQVEVEAKENNILAHASNDIIDAIDNEKENNSIEFSEDKKDNTHPIIEEKYELYLKTTQQSNCVLKLLARAEEEIWGLLGKKIF